MSLTAPTRPGSPGAPAAPTAPSVARVQPRRRSPMLVALGVALTALGTLGAYAYTAATGPDSFLAVARPVAVGVQISDDDLRTVDINAAPGLQPIPAGDRSKYVGRHAKVDLVPGTLLTADQVTDASLPGQGEQLFGVELKPAQMPTTPLKRGDKVLLVVTPDARTAVVPDTKPNQPPAAPVTIEATVANVGPSQTNGQVVVDVVVPRREGPNLVSLSAQGRLALAVLPRN
ncbi:SAF domain-containing protein [Micromonospora aurantiaca (nom. illeg.)]|uniref:SAF domain-containing protein n=1 Tax=Micromonospora aurantiaca (nom. illeg.) TaxID=47850 RepID=UPI0033DAE148